MELFSGSYNDLLGCGYTVFWHYYIHARQCITGNRDREKYVILRRRSKGVSDDVIRFQYAIYIIL